MALSTSEERSGFRIKGVPLMTAPGAGYGTSFPSMQSAVQGVHNVQQELSGAASKLITDLVPLENTWKGEAATAFQGLKERFTTDLKKLNDALNDIAELLQNNAALYQQQEADQTHSLSAMQKQL